MNFGTSLSWHAASHELVGIHFTGRNSAYEAEIAARKTPATELRLPCCDLGLVSGLSSYD